MIIYFTRATKLVKHIAEYAYVLYWLPKHNKALLQKQTNALPTIPSSLNRYKIPKKPKFSTLKNVKYFCFIQVKLLDGEAVL